jgi:hypothetical protein
MFGYEIPSLRFTGIAGGAVTRQRFLKVNSSGNVVQCVAGDTSIGVAKSTAASGQNVDIYDGIVMVEAGAAVAPGVSVQSDVNGKAITRNAGIALGIALTPAANAGELIAVKTPAIASGSNVMTVGYNQAALAAGVDVAAVPIFIVPAGYKFTLIDASIVGAGASAGIDAGDTSVFEIKVGATDLALKTYNNVVIFPASGVADSLGAITSGLRVAGEVITLSITNGATAATPATRVQLTGILEPA